MPESGELIQQQINKAGSPATGESLLQFDADGSPVIIEGTKMTSEGKIGKTYRTPVVTEVVHQDKRVHIIGSAIGVGTRSFSLRRT